MAFLFLDFILTAGITVTIIVLFLIIKQRNKQLPHFVLIIFFAILLLIIVNFYTESHKLHLLFFISYIPSDIAPWILGPLLFLYIKSIFIRQENLIKKEILHFIPGLLYLLFSSIPILLSFIKGAFVFTYLNVVNEYFWLLINLSNLYIAFYLFKSYKLLLKYTKSLKANYANLTKYDLNWIKHLLIGGIAVISFDLIINIYQNIFGDLIIEPGVATLIAMIILIIYLGYNGIHKSKILLPDFLLAEINTEKQISSKMDENEFKELKQKLEAVLAIEKPYLNEELTLMKLAKLIGTTDKKLSALLNQHMHVSFYDIINKYRVDAVKEKIDSEEYKNYTLLGIAYECGFSSKASFNRIFKKETGLSPSKYKKLR